MSQLTPLQEITVRLVEANVRGQKYLLNTSSFEIDKAIQLANQILSKTTEEWEDHGPK